MNTWCSADLDSVPQEVSFVLHFLHDTFSEIDGQLTLGAVVDHHGNVEQVKEQETQHGNDGETSAHNKCGCGMKAVRQVEKSFASINNNNKLSYSVAWVSRVLLLPQMMTTSCCVPYKQMKRRTLKVVENITHTAPATRKPLKGKSREGGREGGREDKKKWKIEWRRNRNHVYSYQMCIIQSYSTSTCMYTYM